MTTTEVVDHRLAPLAPGAIWYSSWGYDQTNIDYYQVVRSTEKSVWLQRIGEVTTETSFMSGHTVPNAGHAEGEPHRHLIRKYKSWNGGAESMSVKITDYANAYPWDGQPKFSSWYH